MQAAPLMASTADETEARLRSTVLPFIQALLPAGEFVMPDYTGLGIANLPATIAALFGAGLKDPSLPPLRHDIWAAWSDGLRRIVLVVIDALGYLQLRAAMAQDERLVFHRLADAGSLMPITSTFPSTTNTVLSTLWTGFSPAAHGILAYELYLRELGVAASTLFFWPIAHRRRDSLAEWGIDADKFVPVPGLATQLAAHGIMTRSLISKAYAESLLSRIHRRGVREVVPFVAMGDMWAGLQQIIERRRDERLLLMAYWDSIDGITHQYGPHHHTWDIELAGLSWMMERAFLSRLTPAQRKGTLLLLVADHGGVATPPAAAVRLDRHPELRNSLALPPLGESRVPFLHVRGDALARVQGYLQERLAHCFALLTREQVLNSGLLGPGPIFAETPHRLGDLIGLARGNHYLARDSAQLKTLGRHGGLQAEEMMVPLLGVRLDAL